MLPLCLFACPFITVIASLIAFMLFLFFCCCFFLFFSFSPLFLCGRLQTLAEEDNKRDCMKTGVALCSFITKYSCCLVFFSLLWPVCKCVHACPPLSLPLSVSLSGSLCLSVSVSLSLFLSVSLSLSVCLSFCLCLSLSLSLPSLELENFILQRW